MYIFSMINGSTIIFLHFLWILSKYCLCSVKNMAFHLCLNCCDMYRRFPGLCLNFSCLDSFFVFGLNIFLQSTEFLMRYKFRIFIAVMTFQLVKITKSVLQKNTQDGIGNNWLVNGRDFLLNLNLLFLLLLLVLHYFTYGSINGFRTLLFSHLTFDGH